MSVALKNVSRQTIVIELDHPAFHTAEAGFQRKELPFVEHNGETGERTVVAKKRSMHGSLTLLPGQTVGKLHAAIEQCTDVKNDARQRVRALKVTQEAPEPVSVPETTEAAPAAEPAPEPVSVPETTEAAPSSRGRRAGGNS